MRQELGRQARERLMAEHTYAHRAYELIGILQDRGAERVYAAEATAVE